MPEQRGQKKGAKYYNRISVVFGRPSWTGRQGKVNGKKSEVSCIDGCFAALLGYPPKESIAPEHGVPKELDGLPTFCRWDDLPEEHRARLQVHTHSAAKEGVPGWNNQDATLACCPQRGVAEKGSAPLLFAVFDGHGKCGHDVSRLAAERLPGHLATDPDILESPERSLERALRCTDDDVYAKLGQRVEYSGTTAAVVLFDPDRRVLHVANVGDSRVVLGHHSPDGKALPWDAVPLTQDQTPDVPEERHRIELSGGFVGRALDDGTGVGPLRVWEHRGREKPGLACSRSIGDGCARGCGVIAEPVITTHPLQPGDKFLLIATDGLWDSVGNDEAVRIAGRFFGTAPQVAVKALTQAVRRAEEGELCDDTTIVMVALPDLE